MRHRISQIPVIENVPVKVTQTDLVWNPSINAFGPGASVTTDGTFTVGGFRDDYSDITDEEGPYVGNIPKVVDHTTVRCAGGTGPVRFVHKLHPFPAIELTVVNFESMPFWSEGLTCLQAYNEPNLLAGLSLDAFNAFYDQIPSQTSLPNFLLEVGEIKELSPTCIKWDRLRYWAEHLHGDSKHRLKTVGDVMRAIRNGFLATEFGLKPLLNDIQKITGAAKVVKKRLDYLRKVNGTRRRVHFNQTIDVDPSLFKSTPTIFNNGIHMIMRPTMVKLRFHACCEVFSDLEDIDSRYAELMALLNAFEFNNATKVIWNAIPFSFVVEYFARIQGMINRMEAQPFHGKWDVFNVYHSIDTHVNIECALVSGTTDSFSPHHPPDNALFVKNFAAKRFRRAPGFPGGFSSIQLLSPSPQQKLLMAALMDQKVRK